MLFLLALNFFGFFSLRVRKMIIGSWSGECGKRVANSEISCSNAILWPFIFKLPPFVLTI